MFAKYLAQGFAGTFRLKARLSREAFWPYLGSLVGLFIATGLLLERAGTPGKVFTITVFTVLFASAFWRRRNDIGVPGWTAVFWVVPATLYLIGQVMGPPIPKPVPDIPAGLGDAGLFLFLTPEFGNAASVRLENSLNDLWYQVAYIMIPAAIAVSLAIFEIVLGRKPSKTY